MRQRILITGCKGFLGRSFLRSFHPGSAEVVALEHAGCADCAGIDLTDRDGVRAVLRELRPSHILNFASRGVTRDASTLADLLAVNTLGALHLVEGLIAEGLTAHTICFGTAYEYADTARPLNEAAPLAPQSPYAISKTTLSYALQQYAGAAPLTLLRLFNVFGMGEPAERLIPFIASKARTNEPIPLTGGEQLRDFMFVNDLVAILSRLLALPDWERPGLRTLNVGTGQGISLKDFIGHVAIALRARGLMPRLAFGDLPYRAQDPMRCVADNTALLTLLGGFSFTDLQTAVNCTVASLDI